MDKHANAALHSLHILVVDDAPVVREPVAAYLRIEGYTVETAANGREGLEKFRTGQFNVVVTDRKMPEMNGDQLAAAIKQIAPNTPVIKCLDRFSAMLRHESVPSGVFVVW